MSYVVLARKWRPQSFEDLVGQEHVSTTIANAITQNRVAHAFLFTGVRGVGKTTSARILAKTLNCEKGPTPTPCQVCPACVEITNGSDVDVQEIDGASYTGVDDVRKLQESMPYRPQRDRFKIFIVDEVHMLSVNAWNAFLKTLEEPPPHVKFIFATTEVHKVPVTILSRCQRYDFKLISAQTIATRLKWVLVQEKIAAEDAAVATIAREAAGSMRDAMSLLDQVIAWVGTAGDKLTAEGVARVLGVADRQVLHRLAGALVDGDPGACVRIVGELAAEGYDIPHVAKNILSQLRDLAVAKVCEEPEKLLDLAPEEIADVRALASRADADDLVRLHQGFSKTFDDVVRGGQPRASLEMTLIRLARRPPLVPIDDLLLRLGDLERRLGGGGGGSAAPTGGAGSGYQRPGRPGGGGTPGWGPRASAAETGPALSQKASAVAEASQQPLQKASAVAEASQQPSQRASSPAEVSHALVQTTHSDAGLSHAPVQTTHSAAEVSHVTVQTTHSAAEVSHVTVQTTHSAAEVSHVTVQKAHSAAEVSQATVQTTHSAAEVSQAGEPGPASARPKVNAPTRPAFGVTPPQAQPARPAFEAPTRPTFEAPPTRPPAETSAARPTFEPPARPTFEAPPARPTFEAPARPTFEAPTPRPPAESSTARPAFETPARPTFEAPPPRPTFEAPPARTAFDGPPPSGPQFAPPPGVMARRGSNPPPPPTETGPTSRPNAPQKAAENAARQPAPPTHPASDADVATWRRLLDDVRKRRPALASVLAHAQIFEMGPQRVVLAYEQTSFLYAQATENAAKDLLTSVVRAHFGAEAEVVFEIAIGRTGTTISDLDAAVRRAKQDAARREVAEHPLVVAAIRTLGAELIDVRLVEVAEA